MWGATSDAFGAPEQELNLKQRYVKGAVGPLWRFCDGHLDFESQRRGTVFSGVIHPWLVSHFCWGQVSQKQLHSRDVNKFLPNSREFGNNAYQQELPRDRLVSNQSIGLGWRANPVLEECA